NRSLEQKTTAKPQQQPQPPSRASLLSSCAPTNPRTENEADDEVNASTVRSDGFNIYAAGFGCDSRAPCWTAARLLSDSASPGTILYTGLFDAIGGGPDCARAVAAMSADYAAVAHLHTPSRQRRHSCSFARQDADLCGLTLPSPSDPCCVPMHGEWARRLAQTGAVGTAVSMETSVRSGG
uniref:Metallophos_C domain-containing protein n=1 Tax=Macrostomum lignano TaxID=282301 RepID=A0A1I8IMZ8_9PLAT